MLTATSGAFDPQGPVARAIDDLWWQMLALGTAAFVIFGALLVVGLRRRGADDDDVSDSRPNRFILLGGVVLPTVVLTIVMVLTVRTMAAIPSSGRDDALRIDVIGHQWWYEVRYPQRNVVTANEIHLPVGRQVELRLTSADVIHSFWIPELGGKLDLLPGDVNVLVLEADRPGVHRTMCAEFCGLQHAKMAMSAVVETEDDFAAWLDARDEPATPPVSAAGRRGAATFVEAGCASCHTVRGTAALGDGGPDLTHLASRDTLAAATLANTPENLARWIADPHEIKEGVDMPVARLDDREMADLLEYLESLR